MKITGTRSYILVEFDHRSVKIAGELTTTPVFYASIKSIKNWEPPYDSIPVSESEKREIVNRVLQEIRSEFKILFED
jgi:hypothetical protein